MSDYLSKKFIRRELERIIYILKMSLPILNVNEGVKVGNAFLLALYGEDLYNEWREMKVKMEFNTEKEYVAWLIDIARHYNNHISSTSGDTSSSNQYLSSTNYKRLGRKRKQYELIGSVEDFNPTTSNDTTKGFEIDLVEDCKTEDLIEEEVDSCDPVVNAEVSEENEYYSTSDCSTLLAPCTRDSHACPHCDYQAKRKDTLKHHLVYKHGYYSHISCHGCGKGFHSYRPLHKHLLICKEAGQSIDNSSFNDYTQPDNSSVQQENAIEAKNSLLHDGNISVNEQI